VAKFKHAGKAPANPVSFMKQLEVNKINFALKQPVKAQRGSRYIALLFL
jgi:hypothetical protein